MKKTLLALAVLLVPLSAFAVPMADLPIKMDRTDVSSLAKDYDYLTQDEAQSNHFIDKHPNAEKFAVFTKILTPQNDKRRLFIIQEQGSYACGTQSCPVRVFDVTNEKKPKELLNEILPSAVHTAQCPDKYSLVFAGSNNLFERWTLGKDGFELHDTYQSLKTATSCKAEK